jgi:hypothetical protein
VARKLPDVPETEVIKGTDKSPSELKEELPDVPTTEPKRPDEPESKKLKSHHEESEDLTDDGWEKVEKPNAYPPRPTVEDAPEEKAI